MKAFWSAENWLRLRILSVALIVLLPASAVAFMNVDAARQEQFELVAREDLMTARLLAEQQATLVAATEQILRLLATSRPVLEGSVAECNAEMRRVMSSLSGYANVGMAGADGFIRCSAVVPAEEPTYIGDRDYFRMAMERDGFTRGSYQVGRISEVASVNFGFPVRDAAGAPTGVVYAAMDLRTLQGITEASRGNPHTLVIFLDGAGIVLHAPPEAGLEPGAPVDADLMASLVTLREGNTRYTFRERESLVSFQELDNDGGVSTAFVVVATPVDVVQAQAESAFWTSALVLAVAAIVGIVGAFVLAEQIVVREHRERLRERSARIEALQEGDRKHVMMVNEIAHDLRSPLAPIKLQLYMLRRGDGLSARQAGAVEVLERNVEHMERLVEDLRDVFRTEAAKFIMEPKPVDLSRQLREARDTFQELARRKGIELNLEAEPDLQVTADPDRLNQAVFNLISNAIKFTSQEGNVTIAAQREGAAVRVAVTDEGPGLTEDEMERLFKPFSQVGSMATREKGTGLGLYISKSIIEGHGGQAGVTSAGRGKGSTFWFTLPVEGMEETAAWDVAGMRDVETR